MTTDTLSRGLSRLCHNDSGVDSLIAPRRERVVALLSEYINEIVLYNPTLGLVGTEDPRQIITRHILDSLAPLSVIINDEGHFLDRNLPFADVGSGAGLPGIPLAITLPNVPFVLIERMTRRTHFLRNTLTKLGLSNVMIEEAEMEKVQRERFSLVMFRAFRPLEPKIFKKLLRLCGEDGALAAYKGKRDKIEAEMTALEKALPDMAGHWRLVPCPVPMLDEERHLILIYKNQQKR